ncbi:cyclodextrin-binding protein [Clostridia bacterium]|nr:cyclodextrin-binding protein [Clostridia bacterium]
MLKNILAIAAQVVVVCAIILVFGAFGENQKITPPPANDKFDGELERGVTIRVLENDTAIQQGYFAQLLTAFNEKYAEYGITAVDANMDQYLDLENDGPFGYGPDVLYQANDVLMKYPEGGHILPLPIERLDCYSHVSAAAWSAYLYGGKYYGAPVNVQAPVLYYRKDLLPDGDTSVIESWNALYGFSKERGAEGKYGYMKSLFDVYFAAGYLFSYGGYVFGGETTDVGFAEGGAEKGAWVIKQLAGVMNEDCIDDTVTKNAYSKIASGDYFATITTPDVYTLFVKEMILAGVDPANLAAADIPKLPASGDLTEENPELIPSKMMGGVNGYGVSAYTKAPNACLAFVDFAAGYEMAVLRSEKLGVVPARRDAAENIGDMARLVNRNLENGNIVIMPSVRAVAQIWTPMGTFFSDVAKDAFRSAADVKYPDLSALKAGLEKANRQVYDAIHTLR